MRLVLGISACSNGRVGAWEGVGLTIQQHGVGWTNSLIVGPREGSMI